jgi:hypothetical protein
MSQEGLMHITENAQEYIDMLSAIGMQETEVRTIIDSIAVTEKAIQHRRSLEMPSRAFSKLSVTPVTMAPKHRKQWWHRVFACFAS